mgnify:CR=1 FL=1
MGELALCVVGKVLRFVAAGFLGCEVAVPVPGEAFVLKHQQAVACPAARGALWQVLALVAQYVEVGVGQAAAHGLGPFVFLALAVGAFVTLLLLLAGLVGAACVEQVVCGVEGEAFFAVVTVARCGDAAQGVVGVGACSPAFVGYALQLACAVVLVLALDDDATNAPFAATPMESGLLGEGMTAPTYCTCPAEGDWINKMPLTGCPLSGSAAARRPTGFAFSTENAPQA